MKLHQARIATLAGLCLAATTPLRADLKEGMKEGAPDLQSIGALTFGPQGILFVADPKGAAVFAIDLGMAEGGMRTVQEIDGKIAALLGTTRENIVIEDLAVDQLNAGVYLSVSRGRGPEAKPALVRAGKDGLELVDLEKVRFSKAPLADAPEDKEVGEGRRRENRRLSSITDMAWVNGMLAVAGLSNEEFASTLRVLDFPFTGTQKGSSVEIYHAAHGATETHSPIRTLVPMDIAGEASIVASYTCTPLVVIPVKQIEPKAKITGKTIAELGNRNKPLDMIEYEKDGKRFILMANSARGIMKVDANGLAEAEALTEPVRGGGAEGVGYETIEGWEGVMQLAKLDETDALIIRQDEAGLHLDPRRCPEPRLRRCARFPGRARSSARCCSRSPRWGRRGRSRSCASTRRRAR